MTISIHSLFLVYRNKPFLIVLLLFFVYNWSYGQSCNCESPPSCGPCEGGLVSITFQYTGPDIAHRYLASDESGTLANDFVDNNIFVVNSSGNGAFAGDYLTVNVVILGSENITEIINVSCDDPIYQGSVFGDLTVLAGESLNGGPLCCNSNAIDDEPPIISNCPSDIDLTLDSGCSIPANWTEPEATDECGIVSFVSSHTSGDVFPLGTTEVVYTATDDAGNTSTCTFNVTVKDETMPVFSGCPADISISTTSSCEATVDWTEPSASDNCSTELTATGSHSPGDVFPLGTTEVVYTATDEAGNTSTCTFNVTVTDETMPVFSDCPADISISTTSSCEATADWTEPSVSDNCSTELTATGSHSPGDVFPLGTTEVVYTATDEAGNTSTCTFSM
ncbi:HYR domain-containing protein [Marivirga sp. S37H4]|uniref:HYR domain-containing protein n=1 Tax=Marivirga aurantiaca TaxID=2802615 RepID=A0A934WWG9_9BACT|nr:HYR domain-containing protein [Marivirga aurantiaca]MBK6264359.1 HYR domain-containing protein [Marivirga aurantiaca]